MNGSHGLYVSKRKKAVHTSSIPLLETQEQTKLIYVDKSQNTVTHRSSIIAWKL